MKLCVDSLSFSYGSVPVLRDISFSLHDGELMSVIGPNGVGKSTLFKCILGALPGYTGTISADGEDMRHLTKRQRAAAVAYIPQIHRPTFGYTVLDTVLMGVGRQVGAFSQPKAEHIDIARDAIARVGVEHLGERDFSHLSGGEQQLVLIARAIAQRSGVLVMDEPTSALDYGNQFRVLELIRSLADEGYSVLLSTHNPQHALSYADTVLALSGGRTEAYGAPGETLNEELMRSLYRVNVEFVSSDSGTVIVPVNTKTEKENRE